MHVDNGSAVNVIYTGYFRQMDIDFSALGMPLSGFAIDTVWPLGVINLPITVSEETRSTTESKYVTLLLDFYVVDAPSPYDVILGKPWINTANAIPSTYHLIVKFPTPRGIVTIRGDQYCAKECMRIAFKGR